MSSLQVFLPVHVSSPVSPFLDVLASAIVFPSAGVSSSLPSVPAAIYLDRYSSLSDQLLPSSPQGRHTFTDMSTH